MTSSRLDSSTSVDGPGPARTGPEVADELVRAATSGDPAAVARLLKTSPSGRAYPVLPEPPRVDRPHLSLSADDVAQEVCLAVLTALPGYRTEGQAVPGVRLRDRTHKVGRRAPRGAPRAVREPVAEVPDSVAPTAGPQQRALHGELSAQLRGSCSATCRTGSASSWCCGRARRAVGRGDRRIVGGEAQVRCGIAQHRALTRLRRTIDPGAGPLRPEPRADGRPARGSDGVDGGGRPLGEDRPLELGERALLALRDPARERDPEDRHPGLRGECRRGGVDAALLQGAGHRRGERRRA